MVQDDTRMKVRHSAGIILDTGVQQWTVPVNTLPYLTLQGILIFFK